MSKQDIMLQFKNAMRDFEVENAEQLSEDFESMITNGSSPANRWDILACGAFKECYDVGSSKVVIKFAASDNETWKEIETLEKAIERGLGWMFLPTAYIDIGERFLPITELDDETYAGYYHYTYDSENHEYTRGEWVETDYVLDYAIVQSRANNTAHGEDNIWSRNEYADNPILDENGNPIDYELLNLLGIGSRKWLETVIAKHGIAMLEKLCDFVNEFGICDLHNCNIGYMEDGSPVIFDWQS